MSTKVNQNPIIIDARLYGPKHTGLGRYTKNLLVALKNQPDFSNNQFTLLVYPELLAEIKSDLGTAFTYYPTAIRHYSISEQLLLPFILFCLKPKLVHFTHLDKPIFYFGKSVVTIHDLIRHFSKGQDTTTKNPLLYWPKYFGYLLMTQVILKTSFIIVPSNFWRSFIIKKFNFNPQKIITTYEAVDPQIASLKSPLVKNDPGDYLLYTGNLYPHKNVAIIFQALKQLPQLKLKIICARNIFSTRAEKLANRLGVYSQIEFLGYVPDNQFPNLYSSALALVHPSFLEGFSLTGLESMSLKCPVIASNSSCLPEIYGDSVLYFDPNQVDQLVKQVVNLQQNPDLRRQLIKKGVIQVKKYSWSKTASETLNFYSQILS